MGDTGMSRSEGIVDEAVSRKWRPATPVIVVT